MLKILSCILLAAFSNVAFATCGSSDGPRPLNVIGDEAAALLKERNFAKLNKLAAEYALPQAFASDGQPKAMGFYAGLTKSNSLCRDEQETDSQWEAHRKLLADWSAANPNLVAPKIALAEWQTSFAWNARGGGYASSVTDEGWSLFRKRLALSRTQLEKLKPKAAVDPEWYAAMLYVAVGQSWPADQFDKLFAEAVAKYPYYLNIYFLKGLFYSSKWHGSQEKFKAFVDETVKATEAKMGQTMYARLNWSAWEPDMFSSGQADWKRMRTGFENMIADYPDLWNRNNFAKFACIAQDKEAVREQFKFVKGHVMKDAWPDVRFYNYCEMLGGQ